MNELNLITIDGQGSSIVSARDLHEFLEVKSKFADWIKNRIIRYGFLEDRDYVAVSKNLENGGREYDYALTLDMAKELSMVERNEKGKQARLYFIESEKRLQKTTAPSLPATEQAIIQLLGQSNQLLANQQQLLGEQQLLLAQLRNDVDNIIAGQSNKPMSRRGGKQMSLPGIPPPPNVRTVATGLRSVVHNRVLEYCGYHGVSTQETYTYLYKRLHEVYSINVYRLTKGVNESLLDAIERYGHLDRLYSLVMAELSYSEY